MYKEYILRPDSVRKTKYNAYKKCLRKCLLEAEKVYYNELFENNKDSVFNLWKTLNPIINPRKTTTRNVINKLVYAGKKIINKQEYQIQWIGTSVILVLDYNLNYQTMVSISRISTAQY